MHAKQTNNIYKYIIQSKLAKNASTQLQNKQSTMLNEIHVCILRHKQTDRRRNACGNICRLVISL